jgi:tetratricopeptide (TPR) repeat protein
VPAVVSAALVDVRAGRPEAASELLRELDEVPEVSIDWYREQTIADLVRICAATGDDVRAARFLEEAGPVTLRHRLSVLTARAVAAEAFGDPEEALTLFEEAGEGWSHYGNVPAAGNAQLGAGRCLARLGRAEARERLGRARSTFADLGAAALVSDADAALAGVP